MQITYVPRSSIYPSFGLCFPDGTIRIREDLPQCVKDFLLDHEFEHRDDLPAQGFAAKELESTWEGFRKHPIGAIVTAIMSLSPYRLRYYVKRFKEKK
jgi:hypothetical protein